MTTRVVHVNDNIEGAVYIGRRMNRRSLPQSPFANPFPIAMGTRGAVIEAYRKHFLKSPTLIAQLPELRGKPLACWCRHDGEPRTEANACHGDVLIGLLERYSDDALRDVCPFSQRVDGPWHSWRWDGDDPRVICHYCNEMRDALTGRVIIPGRRPAPNAKGGAS